LRDDALEAELAATKARVRTLEGQLQRVERNNTALSAWLAMTTDELAGTRLDVATLTQQMLNLSALVGTLLERPAPPTSEPIAWSCSLAPNHKRCRCAYRFEAGTTDATGIDVECTGE